MTYLSELISSLGIKIKRNKGILSLYIYKVMLNSAAGALVKHTQKGNKKEKLMLER
jgi:hypothetical protein